MGLRQTSQKILTYEALRSSELLSKDRRDGMCIKAALWMEGLDRRFPEDPGEELFADLERRARALRRDRYGLGDDFAPKRKRKNHA